MELINPNEIGAKISTLIAEATETFCAVTPYVKISDWKKIIVNLTDAKNRNVKIKFFIREIEQADYFTLKNLGIELFLIPGLHTKLYFNEKEVIVSSMNLYEFSDLHSIDLAILYNDSDSYMRLNNYFKKYIDSKAIVNHPTEDRPHELLKVQQVLKERFSNARINLSGNYLFTKDLIPGFEMFIEEHKTTVRFASRRATEVEIDRFSNNVFNTLKYRTTLSKPSEKSDYYTWDIDLGQPRELELVGLINDINNALNKCN